MANYACGDINYQGFQTQDAVQDKNRIDVTAELAKLPEKEQLTWMRGKLDEFMQTCTFNPDL
ncbi:MAG: hypothetical protein Q3979_07320 [Actinomycetaceae bacterium]|nr:hypothetical protein [Actinomycetaceae bacterium]